MTNQERDSLLINLATSVNNIQNTINDVRVELKSDIKTVDTNLRAEIKKVDTKLDKTANELRAEIKKVDTKLDKTANELRAEINKTAEKNTQELKDFIAFDDTGITEMFKDVWMREAKRDQRLDKHDAEIKELKSKLA